MDARSERPATGYGSPEAGLGALSDDSLKACLETAGGLSYVAGT